MLKTSILTLTLCLSLLANSLSNADPLQAEKESIISNQQRIAELRTVNSDIDSNSNLLNSDLEKLNAQLPAVRGSYIKQQSTLKKVEQQQLETPNSASEGLVKNAGFKFYLAERKYKKLNNSIAQLDRQLSELKVARASNNSQIAALNSDIVLSKERIIKLQAEKEDQQQAVIAARKRQQQERLKAQQAQIAAEKEMKALKQKLLAAENKAKSTAQQVSPPVARPAFPDTTTQEQLQLAHKTEAIEAAEEVRPVLILDQATAKEAVEELDKLVENSSNRNKKINKILHVKTYHNKDLIKQSSHTMKYLGNEQYRAKVKARAGANKLIVGGNSWSIDMPRNQQRQSFDFVLDYRNPNKPILSAYNHKFAN
ncbi:hypothetical protein EDC56_0331 [Sinobacterium caligoides]|uniref:Septal ring factor EnvC (AmiA/AmiB activator) n=1 Tax=Sinobacterium caligoides TaxID=933926 RepID=A0A3N2DYB8_9GAMM|nr:hypothetical protein [Sinobacterium caligoides]ROS04818.1 hypothetical protein EDC56_0331 [Sinobacterium caligoides]